MDKGSADAINVGTEGHVDYKTADKFDAAVNQVELTPEIIEMMRHMQIPSKRGVTKPVFNKSKRTKRNKTQKASRKANRRSK